MDIKNKNFKCGQFQVEFIQQLYSQQHKTTKIYRGLLLNQKQQKKNIIIKQWDENQILQLQRINSIKNDYQFRKQFDPNVVQVYGYKKINNFYYLIMQHYHHNLQQIMKKKKNQLTLVQIYHIFKNLLMVIISLHQRKIIHRCITPKKFYLDSAQKYKISDFRVAKGDLQKSLFQTNIKLYIDLNSYTSPQIIFSDKYQYSSKCDSFSMGVILFQLINKYNIFLSKNVAELEKKHKAYAKKQLILEFNNNTPYFMQEIIRNLLEFEQDDRKSLTQIYDTYFSTDQYLNLLINHQNQPQSTNNLNQMMIKHQSSNYSKKSNKSINKQKQINIQKPEIDHDNQNDNFEFELTGEQDMIKYEKQKEQKIQGEIFDKKQVNKIDLFQS